MISRLEKIALNEGKKKLFKDGFNIFSIDNRPFAYKTYEEYKNSLNINCFVTDFLMNCFEDDITWKDILIFFDSQLKEYFKENNAETLKTITRDEGDKK